MVDILKVILQFVMQYLSFGGLAAILLACALVYIWFQYHRTKLSDERLKLAEERRVALRDELERISQQVFKKESQPDAKGTFREVLIADDEAMIRYTLAEILASKIPNVSVVQAEDGEETLKHIARHSPSLLILDLMMPRKTGFEVLKEVARSTQKFPIIVISGYYLTSKDEIAKIGRIESERILFFTKPFKIAQLLESVKDLLGSEDVK
jgi:two-component system OmpR family response regulator